MFIEIIKNDVKHRGTFEFNMHYSVSLNVSTQSVELSQ